MSLFSKSQPCGRLVLIMEDELKATSQRALKQLLRQFQQAPHPTFLASLAQPSRLAAFHTDNTGLFYNAADDLSLAQTLQYLPWQEIWLVADGQVWQSLPVA